MWFWKNIYNPHRWSLEIDLPEYKLERKTGNFAAATPLPTDYLFPNQIQPIMVYNTYSVNKEHLTDTVKFSNQWWVGWEQGPWNVFKDGAQQKSNLRKHLRPLRAQFQSPVCEKTVYCNIQCVEKLPIQNLKNGFCSPLKQNGKVNNYVLNDPNVHTMESS